MCCDRLRKGVKLISVDVGIVTRYYLLYAELVPMLSRGLKTMVIYLKLTMWNYPRRVGCLFHERIFLNGEGGWLEYKLNHDIICYGSVWGIFTMQLLLLVAF